MIFAMVVAGDAVQTKIRQMPIDEGLFARIGQDDRSAFEELYRVTERTIYTYALSLLKNPHDALDITQETYLKIRASAHLYVPQGKPLAWMFTITRNLSNSLLRRGGRDISAETLALDDSLAHSYIQDPADRLALTAALNTLDERERQIVLLHLVSGLKHREIAGELGIPLGTVLTCYHRGLRRLRQNLSEGGIYRG